MVAPNFLQRVVARIGVSANIRAFIPGEIFYATDTKTFGVGDDTATPPKIPTTKSTDAFDFSLAARFTLPGGIVLDKEKPGLIDGVGLKQMNAGAGMVTRTTDGIFTNRAITSSDGSVTIKNERGVAGDIDISINPDSATASALTVKVTVSATPPSNPRLGQMWFDNEESVLYIYMQEGSDNSFWLSLT